MGNTRASVIESKLTQKPLESKKAIYALIASLCVLIVFGVSALLIVIHAEAAKEITELANLVVLFFGALVTTLITGTAVMDWKAASVLQHIDEDEKIDSNAEAPDVEVKNIRLPKPRYYDDEQI
jgi:membrane protein YdbS with pleckstrin-like domain